MATSPAHMRQRAQELAQELRAAQEQVRNEEGTTAAPEMTESARKEYYVGEIQRLKGEMEGMKKELRARKRKEQAAPSTPARRVLGALMAHSNAAFLGGDSGDAEDAATDGDDDDDDDVADAEHLATAASAALTGIQFTACATHAASPAVTVLTAHGTTHGVAFRVRVHVHTATTEIEQLDVALPAAARTALGDFVPRVCAACSLRGFLRGLAAYAAINARRTALFSACKAAHPDAVLLPHGAAHATAMLVRGAGGHVALHLVWDVRVDEHGDAREHVALHPLASCALAEHDGDGVVARLPALFHKLAHEQGLSAAAHSLVALTVAE